MRLVQFLSPQGGRQVGLVQDGGETLCILKDTTRIYDLAFQACREGKKIEALVNDRLSEEVAAYEPVVNDGRLLPPLDHPDPSRFMISGTGLTHLGSADARDAMHKDLGPDSGEPLTDSKKMFLWGLEGGKPVGEAPGIQPEWFYKGDGSIVVPPEGELKVPSFALDGGEEPEIIGLYIIGPDGCPRRIGFALGNEFSDHVMEKQNYLYLAHSKLRACSFGPELRTGDLPPDLKGVSRIYRDSRVVWQREFMTGEQNMCHSLANLEHHHFKYPQFRRPGDLHGHFFGTSTLSFADDFHPEDGDLFEVFLSDFGRPLRNRCKFETAEKTIRVEVL